MRSWKLEGCLALALRYLIVMTVRESLVSWLVNSSAVIVFSAPLGAAVVVDGDAVDGEGARLVRAGLLRRRSLLPAGRVFLLFLLLSRRCLQSPPERMPT